MYYKTFNFTQYQIKFYIDFLEVFDDKPITVSIPVILKGCDWSKKWRKFNV